MTPEKQERYFSKNIPGNIFECEDDLLHGKIHISEVPFEYRTTSAYIYACRAARGCSDRDAYTEKKLIEHQLLSDIMKSYTDLPSRVNGLRAIYRSYFEFDGINAEGLI